jgi:precorrin-6B methylase 2
MPATKNPAPTLNNYQTGDVIRVATAAEIAASMEAAESDIGGGTGAIVVDGVTCYVEE